MVKRVLLTDPVGDITVQRELREALISGALLPVPPTAKICIITEHTIHKESAINIIGPIVQIWWN